jgi:hypothetical protein
MSLPFVPSTALIVPKNRLKYRKFALYTVLVPAVVITTAAAAATTMSCDGDNDISTMVCPFATFESCKRIIAFNDKNVQGGPKSISPILQVLQVATLLLLLMMIEWIFE